VKEGIAYQRIDGQRAGVADGINTGCVVDAVGRSVFAFSQITKLLLLAQKGQVTSNDVVYLDDFWTPGLEALPYAFHLLGIQPRIYALCHAQSVDEYDFTYGMRNWIRPFECGIGRVLSGIFVCSSILKDLLVQAGVAPADKIFLTGLPYASDEVDTRLPTQSLPRLKQVAYSSRFDSEKNPHFFMDVVERVTMSRPDVRFVVCTSSNVLRSNDETAVPRLRRLAMLYPANVVIREGLTKEQYYEELSQSMVQFNTADQDFVSWTLLEAVQCGCYPIYPRFRSFPEALRRKAGFMYHPKSVGSASNAIIAVLDSDGALWDDAAIASRAWIYKTHDYAWRRMYDHMMQRPQLCHPLHP
jgi:glycosyltransferase involved in cell wall biosynthesis